MNHAFVKALTDADLLSRLQARDTLCFVGGTIDWVEVERQVERLGFGDCYIVSSVTAPGHGSPMVSVKPVVAEQSVGQ